MKDMKEGLTSARKADITHVRGAIKRYIARACEYGSAKYERANFLRSTNGAGEDFERLRKYLRATISHIDSTLDAMERHQATDPNLTDAGGMMLAAYAEDTDAKPGCPVGASGLPHLAHAAASLMMALEQATLCELLPADPGQPWAERKASHLSMVQEAMRRAHPEEKVAELAAEVDVVVQADPNAQAVEQDGWLTAYPKVGEYPTGVKL